MVHVLRFAWLERGCILSATEAKSIEGEIKSYLPEAFNIVGGIVAGGFIRSTFDDEVANDMDIFFRSPELIESADGYITGLGRFTRTESKYAVTFTEPNRRIQLIKVIFGSPAELFNSFDFTVSMCAMPLIEGAKMVKGSYFDGDMRKKRIRVMSCPDPMGTLRRISRYMEYGYKAEPSDILKVYDALALVLPKNTDYPEGIVLPTAISTLAPIEDEYDPFKENE